MVYSVEICPWQQFMNLLELVQINPYKHHHAHAIVSSSASFIKVYKFNTRGGGGTSCSGLFGEALPERGTFFWVQVYEGAGILQDEQAK